MEDERIGGRHQVGVSEFPVMLLIPLVYGGHLYVAAVYLKTVSSSFIIFLFILGFFITLKFSISLVLSLDVFFVISSILSISRK